MFLDFSKGFISSGVILSSVVSFASNASAQDNLDISNDLLDLREDGIHKAKDEEAAPLFEDVQESTEGGTQQVEENEKDLDSKDGIYKAEVPSLEDIQNSDEGETLLARESNEEIGSGDSLNVDPSSTKFAKLKKMGKNVVEKIRKLPPVDVALGTAAIAGVGSTVYFKNKNDKVSDQRDQLEKVVQAKEQKIIALSKDGTKSSGKIVALEDQLSSEQDKFIKFKEEKAKEVENLNNELSAKKDEFKKMEDQKNKEIKDLTEGWIRFIIKSVFCYTVFRAIIIVAHARFVGVKVNENGKNNSNILEKSNVEIDEYNSDYKNVEDEEDEISEGNDNNKEIFKRIRDCGFGLRRTRFIKNLPVNNKRVQVKGMTLLLRFFVNEIIKGLTLGFCDLNTIKSSSIYQYIMEAYNNN